MFSEHDFPGQNIAENPEKEKEKERRENAGRALRDYAGLVAGENVLFLVDEMTNSESLRMFQLAIRDNGADYEVLDLGSNDIDRADLNKSMEKNKLIIKLSSSRYEALQGIFDEDLKNNDARMLNLFDIEPDLFNNDGAMSENFGELEDRLNRMGNTLEKAAGFRVTSVYGTDLTVGLRRFKERKWHKCDGKVKPGTWDNWPGGEIFTTPDESNVNGILVLPVLNSDFSSQQGVDDYVRITVKDGVIVKIDGQESAEVLRKRLEDDMQEEDDVSGNPLNVLRIAEIAFGANSLARGMVASEHEPFNAKGNNTLEAEKRFGTIHLAFGSGKHGEEGVDGFEDAVSHYDFVIPRTGLTVEMFTDDDGFKERKGGQRIISEGGVNYF